MDDQNLSEISVQIHGMILPQEPNMIGTIVRYYRTDIELVLVVRSVHVFVTRIPATSLMVRF